MHVAAGRYRLAGKADDLAVLVDRLAFGDIADSNFVSQADASFQRKPVALDRQFSSRRKIDRGDGNIILRA